MPEGDKKGNDKAANLDEKDANPKVPDANLPVDALGKTNKELASAERIDATTEEDKDGGKDGKPKKVNPIKKLFKKVDVYLLGFVLLIAIAGVFTGINFLNSKKTPKTPTVNNEQLSTDALKALQSSGTSVGGSAQTVTLQGNVIFNGQVLIRSSLAVAGNFEVGGAATIPSITVSGSANLPSTQASSLQVAQGLIVQGSSTLNNITVSGPSTFNGAVTANQLTVSDLIISGAGVLNVPNHIAFTGAPPGRSGINYTVLGAGGTATVQGSDNSGTIVINTGNNPTPGCFLTVVFAKGFAALPHVMISPVNIGAAETQYYVEKTNNNFNVCAANTPPANQAFAYDYWVTGQ
jgi:cytoskeletal protein CcmA (bactofilin family)